MYLIQSLPKYKTYGAKRLLKMFPDKIREVVQESVGLSEKNIRYVDE